MHKEIEGYIIVDPKNKPINSTFNEQRKDTIENFIINNIKAKDPLVTWRGLYQLGYRCIKGKLSLNLPILGPGQVSVRK